MSTATLPLAMTGAPIEADAHEVARDLVRWTLNVAGAERARRVVHIRVRLGPHPRFTRDDLELAIRVLSRWTIAEGADVEVFLAEAPGVAIDAIGLN